MKRLHPHSRWRCLKCGFEADGQTWNSNWLQDGMLWGALYKCPNCKDDVELKKA